MTELHIVECDAHTPLGLTATESIAAFRAGLTRLMKYEAYQDKHWESVTVSMIQYIPDFLELVDRYIDIGLPVLDEILKPIVNLDLKGAQVPIYIGLPEARPGLSEALVEELEGAVTNFTRKLGMVPNISLSKQGHASAFIALQEVSARFENGELEFAIIGGIESYLHEFTLDWLESNKRLHRSYGTSGFIPGEGASFFLVATDQFIKQHKLASKAKIMGVSSSSEKNSFGSKTVNLGMGLTRAAQTVLKVLENDQQVHQVFCGINGEDYHSIEWGHTAIKLAKRIENPKQFVSGTKAWGDLGAATAPMLVCQAVHSGEWGYASGPLSLLLTSSLGKDRAAVLLDVPINEKRRKKWAM